MTKNQAALLVEAMKYVGITFEPGLTDAEVAAVEKVFARAFPPDLRMFLQTALPIEDEWVNWREGLNSDKVYYQIMQSLDWPQEGLLFDVEHNIFWLPEWGERTENTIKNLVVALEHFEIYPLLVPIFLHRYMPQEPSLLNNPVFSVYQTDIIYYGYNLADYFVREFGIKLPPDVLRLHQPARTIPFWSDCAG